MNFFRRRPSKGFTIVELLIVIVVIAILAAIVIVAYNNVTARAQASKVAEDLATLDKAMEIARNSVNNTLIGITGNQCTRCACPYVSGDLTKYNTLAQTNNCWVQYDATLDKLTAASGINLSSLKRGDPWGSPYAIDENELENGACNKDHIWSFGSSSNANGGTNFGDIYLPFYTAQCGG